MSDKPKDRYDLSHLVEDPALKRQFQTQAWRQMVEVRIEFGGDTQEQAAQFLMRKYAEVQQPDAKDSSGPQYE